MPLADAVRHPVPNCTAYGENLRRQSSMPMTRSCLLCRALDGGRGEAALAAYCAVLGSMMNALFWSTVCARYRLPCSGLVDLDGAASAAVDAEVLPDLFDMVRHRRQLRDKTNTHHAFIPLLPCRRATVATECRGLASSSPPRHYGAGARAIDRSTGNAGAECDLRGRRRSDRSVIYSA